MIKVGCWNIGSYYQGAENSEKLWRVLEKENFDVFCAQETPNEEEVLGAIKKRGGFSDYVLFGHSPNHNAVGKTMATAIFVKGTATLKDTVKLPTPKGVFYYNGKAEYMHDKYFALIACETCSESLKLISGHSFSFHRYGEDENKYPEVFSVIEDFLLKNTEGQGKTLVAADFNASSPLSLMPRIRERFFDLFEGVGTRPSGRHTDSVLLRAGREFEEKQNIRVDGFDHHYLSVTL